MRSELTQEELAALPRAPSQAAWDAMGPEERAAVVAALPSYMHEVGPPEGDFHAQARELARGTLCAFFRPHRPGVYVTSELAVYYPATQRFSPDLFVVFDVDPHPRDTWVVSHEGKGIDFALEVLYHGDRKKDLVENVELYARLGIPEYFVLDLTRERLIGYRLEAGPRYTPIVPQYGRYASQVLGMDLEIAAGRLQFYVNTARLYSPPELAQQLREKVAAVEQRLVEEQRAREEERRAREEEKRAREEAERRLAEALARLEALED